jgi:predicted DNA-binding protein (MmcQ/YjbR family)
MDLETIRRYCMSLPHVEEDVKWEHLLTFLVGRKMFCVVNLEPARENDIGLGFKASPEEFAELVEREGVIPAPYMARNHWVSLQEYTSLPWRELQERIARSYELVKATLPKKVQAALDVPAKRPASKKAPKKCVVGLANR